MSIKVSQAFERTSSNPIDATMALTKAQMLTINDNLMPDKYLTVCQDDGDIYLYDKTATPSAETGKFTKFEGGGSSSGISITKTLLAANWDANNQQSLTFDGYETSMGGVIGMPTNATAAQKEAYASAKINVYSQSGAVITFECDDVPAVDLPVTLYAGGGSGGGSADLPSGGTTGQALVKHSNADGDVEWGTINSIPDGGTTGQALVKASDTDKDVEWGTVKKSIEDNGTAVTDRDTVNFVDFDIEDDDTAGAEKTNVSAHRLTSGELAEICSTLPGAPTQYPKYSTTEQVVGEWIDGKPIYQKTVDFGALPNATTKNVPHGISNLDYIIEVYGVSSDGGSIQANLPYVNPASLSNAVSIKINGSNIQIITASNMSTFTKTYVTLRYTKTTD